VRDEIRPIADLRLRRSLVLSEVAEAEKIEATDQEVDDEINKMTEAAGAQAQQLRELFTSENGKETIRRNLVTRKTLSRLVEIATQDGGATVEKKPKAKKKKDTDAAEAEDASNDEEPAKKD
jgi:trigger factor